MQLKSKPSKSSRAMRYFILISLFLLVIQPLSACMGFVPLSADTLPETTTETLQVTTAETLLPTTESETTATQAPTTTTTETIQPTTVQTTTVVPTATPKPTPKPTAKPTAKPTPKPTPKPVSSSPYYLYAELGSYTMQIYGKDAKGDYTVPVRRIRIAIGRGTMTPRGKFTLGSRERWHTFGSAYTQYAVRYYGGLYIHAPLYRSKNVDDMISSYYTSIGTASTSGCLRMTTGDVYWIYNNCPSGTIIEIVSGSPRGLVKPALPPLISPYEDPTDPLIATTPTETTETTTESTTEATTSPTTEGTTETSATETTSSS